MIRARHFLVLTLFLAGLPTRGGTPFGATEDWSGRRQYAPDRDMQALHLALDVTPDFRRRTISGEADFTFEPIAQPMEQLKLDAVDLRIASVESADQIAAWNCTTDKLIITFASAIPAGKETTVKIRYSAEPRKGLYFRTPEMGYKAADEHVFSQGEADESRHWFPCYDSPNEKFTSEVTCHVPEGMIALSNGRLVSEDKDTNGLAVFHWAQKLPHVNYLITLVAGHFKKWEDRHGEVPLPVYTPPTDAGDVALSFGATRDVMDYFEQEIGMPYPWAKYGQVVVQDFVAGGMENTSLTTLATRALRTAATENIRDSDGLISHEMAHQWFGDLVTCKDWSHLWLNEGFATYYANLYHEHKNGADAGLYAAYGTARQLFALTNDHLPIVSRKFNDPDDQFDYRAYEKGGYVLRMLRAELGGDLYRRCIKTYLERHKFGNVVTDDLARVIEELSGRSFDRFFDQWVYHAHYPELNIGYSWDEKTRQAKISVEQTQTTSDDVLLFQFPLTVAFRGKGGAVERVANVSGRQEDFYFNLDQAPETVTIDPRLAVLAKINFRDYTARMAESALGAPDDLVGRLRAVEKLSSDGGVSAVERLKKALREDAFYGVRLEAAKGLATLHSEESLAALLDAGEQKDARVRQGVVAALGEFYDERAFAAEKKALSGEENPDVAATEIRALGAAPLAEARETLLLSLHAPSYKNTIANASIAALRAQDDTTCLGPICETLKGGQAGFTDRDFAAGLETVGSLGRELDKKDEPREFLLGYLTSKRQGVRLGAIRGLGLLGDARTIPALATFAQSDKDGDEAKAADEALETIRAARKPEDNLQDLRKSVLDLQTENRKLREDLDALQKKADAAPEASDSHGAKPRKTGH